MTIVGNADTKRRPDGAAAMLVRSGGAPLYAQLAAVLRERIASGLWSRGDVLPAIDLLMEEFGVSRVTVRDAIKVLSQEGLLSPQRGRGTIVTGTIAPRPLRVEGTLDDLIDSYRGDRPDIETMEDGFAVPTFKEGEALAAADYFHARRVHTRDGVRYCQIGLYIERGLFERAPDRFRGELVLPLLRELGVEVAAARQTVTIGKCLPSLSTLLSYPIGDPIANVRRVLLSPAGEAIYFAEVAYRGDCIRFDMNLTP